VRARVRGLAADYPIQRDFYCTPTDGAPASFPMRRLVLAGYKGFPEQFEGLSHTKVQLMGTIHFLYKRSRVTCFTKKTSEWKMDLLTFGQ